MPRQVVGEGFLHEIFVSVVQAAAVCCKNARWWFWRPVQAIACTLACLASMRVKIVFTVIHCLLESTPQRGTGNDIDGNDKDYPQPCASVVSRAVGHAQNDALYLVIDRFIDRATPTVYTVELYGTGTSNLVQVPGWYIPGQALHS